jgi:transposase
LFIKKTSKKVRGKTYVNHLLVESVATPKGPRHRVVCSLGSLAPAPREEWRAVAQKIESALAGQDELLPDVSVAPIVARIKARAPRTPSAPKTDPDLVVVHTDRVEVKDAREAGPVHVGHQMWKKLEVDKVLEKVGLDARSRRLTEVMTLNRLIFPSSEHAMPDWTRRTALSDILGESLETLTDDQLYRNLDRLHPERAAIEEHLAERERSLFNLTDSFYLYDLTSTYFEGQCLSNEQAKRGYSRDSRPDCKQVVVGLVLDRDGFPRAHEVFDGNKVDRTTVDEMLKALEKRCGKKPGTTVIVDRGMAYDENLKAIKDHGHHYLVASRQPERNAHLSAFEDEAGWTSVIREPSPTNPGQKKSEVRVKRAVVGEELHVLCHSEGREAKDRAIREKHEQRFLKDLEKLKVRVAKGRLREDAKIQQAIGRLCERYPRVARYHRVAYDASRGALSHEEQEDRKEIAKRLDGTYMLKTDRKDLSDEEIWKTYMLLTRVEAAFRAMKSPLAERPIFHHVKRRVETHIFLCVLAYHLLISIETMARQAGLHASWATIREQVSTHQVVTVVLPTSSGDVLEIRRGSTPEPTHRALYEALHIPNDIVKPRKTWMRHVVTEFESAPPELRGSQ